MIEKYLQQTEFSGQEDFEENYKIVIPEQFNFAYDVVDEWASISPGKIALKWTNDQNVSREFTFGEIKKYSDQAASFFQTLGLKKGDMVMAILKRRVEFWFTIIALHKIGVIIIPATHLLTKKDLVYRNNAADIKAIIAVGEEPIIGHINDSMVESPTVKHLISIGPEVPDGWLDFQQGIESAPDFVSMPDE